MRRLHRHGFSLVELAVIVALAGILLGVGATSYFRYRSHVAVNTAAETVEGLLVRAREEAKASGYPVGDDLRTNGVATAAPPGRQGGDSGAVAARIRKRYRAGQQPQVVTTRDLSSAAAVEVEVVGLGTLDIETETDREGVYFEILVKNGPTASVLAAIPIDVNGEMMFQGQTGQAAIRFSRGAYNRTLELTRRGVINPDRR